MERAGRAIRQGGVVVFPAQCLYGLACDAANPRAIQSIFKMKQRPETKALLILIDQPGQIKNLVKTIPPGAHCLMEAFWPGGITLVFGAADHLDPTLTAGTGKIGIRLPGHPVARALTRAAGCPITGTSANVSGQPGCPRPDALPESICQRAAMVLNAGPLAGGMGSTVVDLTQQPFVILRQGVVSKTAIQKSLEKDYPHLIPV